MSIVGDPPELVEPLKEASIVVPEKVTLKCGIKRGKPAAEIHWYKESKEIYKSARQSMDFSNNVASLVITKSQISDGGTYRCEAINKLGHVETEAELTVQAAPNIEYDSKMKTQSLKCGKTLIITATITGLPTPKAAWSLNGQPLQRSVQVNIETKDTYSTLTVKSVTVQDAGTYTLSAQNEVGSTSADFTVVIKGKVCDYLIDLLIYTFFCFLHKAHLLS